MNPTAKALVAAAARRTEALQHIERLADAMSLTAAAKAKAQGFVRPYAERDE